MKRSSGPTFTSVAEVAAARPEVARQHFETKLAFETDPADVEADMRKGAARFTLVDTRAKESYEDEHIPGAINLPVRHINAEAARRLDKDALYVTYCWGPGCNGSTKGAARLATLGFHVKEMIGGIEYWKREGYPTEGAGRLTPSRRSD